MEALERRQAGRIVRNAREAERDLFELIEELQLHCHPDTLPFDWECTSAHVENVRHRLDLIADLVNNTVDALELSEGGAV